MKTIRMNIITTLTRTPFLLLLLPLLGSVVGCTGTQTFTTAARAGETVTLAVGYRQNLKRQNMTVTIKDSSGAIMTYLPNNTHVRGVINLYPDPVSKVRIAGPTAALAGTFESGAYPGGGGTNGDPDWWLTTVLLDLPTTMSNGNPIKTGQAQISIADTGGNVILPANVEILAGASSTNLFNIYAAAGGFKFDALGSSQFPTALKQLERGSNFTVTFTPLQDSNGLDIMPNSLQAVFTHTANVGAATVINPRTDLKNIAWSDDGATLKVMLTPPNGNPLVRALDLKFYVAGNVTNLILTSLKAYDVNGQPMTGITPMVTPQ